MTGQPIRLGADSAGLSSQKTGLVWQIIIATLAWVWLLQVLHPWQVLAEVETTWFFPFYLALWLLSLAAFRARPWLTGAFGVLLVLAFIHGYFYYPDREQSLAGLIWYFFTGPWWEDFARQLLSDALLARSGNWPDISGPGQTTAILVLLALTGALVRLGLVQEHGLFLLILGAGTLAGLVLVGGWEDNSFTGRYFLLGLILLTTIQASRMSIASTLNVTRSLIWALTASVLVVALSYYTLPKNPAPLNFWLLTTGEFALPSTAVMNGFATQRTGYGNDDSRLGGPFVPDDTVVLEVKAQQGYYWRGQAMEYYTSAGWITRIFRSRQPLALGQILTTPGNPSPEVKTLELHQQVTVGQAGFPVLFGAASVTQVVETGGRGRLSIAGDSSISAGQVGPAFSYHLVSRVTAAEPSQIRQLAALGLDAIRAAEDTGGSGWDIPEGPYLQLPPSLPARVRHLARDLTLGLANPYDRLEALRSYLLASFSYATDVPPPPSGRDFVDHFLFDLQRGYCDHFSSALVVLARSVGLPARWVKGFTAGTPGEAGPDGLITFTVRNNNAHSWAEVYFPGYGWLAVEATPGFALPAYQPESNRATSVEPDSPDSDLALTTAFFPQAAKALASRWQEHPWTWIFAGGVVLYLLVSRSSRKSPFRDSARNSPWERTTSPEKALLLAWEVLLAKLARRGWIAQEGETSREFLKRLAETSRLPSSNPGQHPGERASRNKSRPGNRDREFPGKEELAALDSFIALWEKVRYGRKKLDPAEARLARYLWDKLAEN